MAPGRQRKGDRWCRNKHKVQRREKRKEAEMLKCRFKQKEIWSSSKSLTPCTEGPEMHMKGLCSCPIYSRYRTAVRWSTQQVRCPFFFFSLLFFNFFLSLESDNILTSCQQTQNLGKPAASNMWRTWPQNSLNTFQNNKAVTHSGNKLCYKNVIIIPIYTVKLIKKLIK